MRVICRTVVVLLGAAGASLPGCGSEATQQSCDVTGVVKVDGAPAAGGYVYFYPTSERQPAGFGIKTEANGAFAGRLPKAGEYAVTVTWPTVAVVQGEQIEGDDRLKGLYRDPYRPVLKVTIQGGANAVPPINLRRP